MKSFEKGFGPENQETMTIPKEIEQISKALEKAGFDGYLVGGCVRDFLLEKNPKDWDLTTNATPEEILKTFPDSFYENKFGTVGVKTESDDPSLAVVEITTFRLEGKYTDKRHPDEIKFAKTVEEDLARRDFTINALALSLAEGMAKPKITDPFGGKKDLEKKIIRAVGNPQERFQEDALRLMRAVRFAAQLGFSIEEKTAKAVKENAGLLEFIAKERITDELGKLLMTENGHEGIKQMQELGLLKYVMPELEEGVNMEQNKHHKYTVFEHNLRALQYAVEKKFPLELRLASLLHDVGKSRVRIWKDDPRGEKTNQGQKGDWTFYQHQYVGEKMALEMLDRLHFPRKTTEKIALLVREHMFAFDPELSTPSSARRLLRRVGLENIDDLFLLREADRIGSGVPKAQPYRLRALKAMVEQVKQDPILPKMIALKGDDVMRELKIEPGPKVGWVLNILLDKVLDDPSLNDKEKLMKLLKELGKMSGSELSKLSESAKEKVGEVQNRIDEEIKRKYFVK